MQISLKKSHLRLLLFCALLAAALFMRGSFMDVSLHNLYATSDECIQALQAKHIAQGQRPLLLMSQPYQFPLSAYIMAGVIMHTDRDTFGARWLAFAFGLTGLFLLCLICRELGPWRESWPAWLLVLFPSVYLLVFQAAYAPTNHDSILCLWALGLWLLLRSRRASDRRAWLFTLAGGLALGLSLSVHLLGASITAFSFLLCLQGRWRSLLARLGGWALGLGLGLVPYFLAFTILPHAYRAVTGTRPLSWLYQGPLTAEFWAGLHQCLSGVLGFATVTYIDTPLYIDLFDWLPGLTPWFFWPLMICVTLICFLNLLSSIKNKQMPRFTLLDVCCLAIWGNICLYVLNTRAFESTHRYLLPVAWCLPFCLWGLYNTVKQTRPIIGALVILLVLLNLGNAFNLMGVWQQPGYSADHANTPDIQPVIDYMDEHNLKYGFSDFWTYSRVTYHTDERIIVSQMYNERFPNVEIPYVDEASKHPQAIYFFRRNHHRNISFRDALPSCEAVCDITQVGDFDIYYNFRHLRNEVEIPLASLEGRTSHNQAQLGLLWDDDPKNYWLSEQKQQPGMFIELSSPKPHLFNRISLDYGHARYKWPRKMELQAWLDGQWQTILADIPSLIDGCRFDNNRLDFTWPMAIDSIRFEPVKAKGLRLVITDPNADRIWSLRGIRVFSAPE